MNISSGRDIADSVFRNKSFRIFLVAVTSSGLGSQVSTVALPLVAILTLGATAAEVGILGMLLYLPVLFVTPFAGVLADKYPPRAVNALADLIRGIVILAIPAFWALGLLNIATVFVVTFVAGVLKAVADVAHHSMLPTVVLPTQLEKGNAAINSSYSVTEVAGPGVGGILVQLLGAPIALVADGASFVLSGLLIFRMKLRREHTDRTGSSNWLTLVGLGFTFLVREPRLLWLGICGGVSNLLLGGFITILPVFLLRTLHFEAWTFGLILGVGALGGVAGAALAGRVRDRLSLVGALLVAEFLGGIGVVIIGLSGMGISPWMSLSVASLGMCVHSAAMGIYECSFNEHATTARSTRVSWSGNCKLSSSFARCYSDGSSCVRYLVGPYRWIRLDGGAGVRSSRLGSGAAPNPVRAAERGTEGWQRDAIRVCSERIVGSSRMMAHRRQTVKPSEP